jgi:hypothetical protein
VLRFVSHSLSARAASRAFAPALAAALLAALLVTAPLDAQQFAFSTAGGTIVYDPADGVGSTSAGYRIEELPGPSAPHLVTGFAMSVAHDPAIATAVSVAQGARLLVLNGGAGPDFFDPELIAGGVTVAVLFSFLGLTSDTYETAEEVIIVGYQAVAAAWTGDLDGGSAALSFTPLGTPPTQNVAIVAGTSIPATGVPGEIDFAPIFWPVWLRGDASGDGVVEPIGDAVSILAQLFSGGAPSACLDAADVNADGAHDISDPITLLIHGFGGGPALPPPFPVCAIAATTLGCAAAVCP